MSLFLCLYLPVTVHSRQARREKQLKKMRGPQNRDPRIDFRLA